ncbi:Prenylcysteine lyase [Sesbania bispinosa]|nr:Prenylcysteine lyase [Sesbania bispinosa]
MAAGDSRNHVQKFVDNAYDNPFVVDLSCAFPSSATLRCFTATHFYRLHRRCRHRRLIRRPFLRKYSPDLSPGTKIRVFERNSVVGGRIATVTVAGETFESRSFHSPSEEPSRRRLHKASKPQGQAASFGISLSGNLGWEQICFQKPLRLVAIFLSSISSSNYSLSSIVSCLSSIRRSCSFAMVSRFLRCRTLLRFLKYYEEPGTRPIFETVDEMLKWAALYNLTTRSLRDELVDAGLSPLLINELVTVITRINYGQSVYMSGLAGAVSLAGSGGGLWSIEGGNWQMAAGLINQSDVALYLHEEIKSIAYLGHYYELNSTKGKSYTCEVAVVATTIG